MNEEKNGKNEVWIRKNVTLTFCQAVSDEVVRTEVAALCGDEEASWITGSEAGSCWGSELHKGGLLDDEGGVGNPGVGTSVDTKLGLQYTQTVV